MARNDEDRMLNEERGSYSNWLREKERGFWRGSGGSVYYGGVGGEDEAGMSIDSGCMRLKQPSSLFLCYYGYYCRPLLLEAVNLQSC